MFFSDFSGRIPSRLVIAMVKSSAYNGNCSESPFNYQPFGCNYMAVRIGGEPRPGDAFTPNFRTGHYVTEYLSLFTGTGTFMTNESNYIERNEYPGKT